MALVNCPECESEISEKALMCPHCGYAMRCIYGFEYRSDWEVFGLPMLHVVAGVNPSTGRPRVAKGIIAVGNIAVGVIAFGGLALGGLCFGGLSLGLACFGGVAIGVLLGVGGLAVGLVAVGGAAIGYYALGGWALGTHALGGNAQDPEAIEFFRRYLGSAVDQFQRNGGQ